MAGVLVDSNVLLDVLTEDPTWFEWSAAALARAAETEVLLINPIVYAEVSVRFARIEELDAALPGDLFRRDGLPWEAGFLAGKCFQAYRRRGGTRRSPLPDFYVGAHAAIRGHTLLTRDGTRYRTYFPKLKLVAPQGARAQTQGPFTQRDPIGLAGGINQYGYAGGDPVNYSDPFGLCITPTSALTCIAAAKTTGAALVTTAEAVAAAGVAISAATASVSTALSSAGTRFLAGARAVAFGETVGAGTVDLASVRARISAGEEGSPFENREGLLPEKPEGYYTKYVIPTEGVRGDGPQRLVLGKGGEQYYTGDHYRTFTRVDNQQQSTEDP